jgi:hypothetical protein
MSEHTGNKSKEEAMTAKKSLKRAMGWVASLCVVLLVIVQLSGCFKNSPTDVQFDGPVTVTESQLNFVSLGELRYSIQDESQLYCEKEVKPHRATMLKVSAEYEEDDEEVDVEIKFRVPPGGISEVCTLSLSLPEDILLSEVDLRFGPHGTVFLDPATLLVETEGLDLSGVDPSRVGIYYHNDDGLWEYIEPIYLDLDIEEGEIEMKCLIEHFSRYALAER